MNVSALQTLVGSLTGFANLGYTLGVIQQHNEMHRQMMFHAQRAGLELTQAHLISVKMFPADVGIGFLFREARDEIGRAQMLLMGPQQPNGLQFHNPFPDELNSLSLISFFALQQPDPEIHEYASLVYLETHPQPGINAANLEALGDQRFDYVLLEPGAIVPRLKTMFDMRIDSLDFGKYSRAIQNWLRHAGIEYVGQLVQRSRRDVGKSVGLGPKHVMTITSRLTTLGLRFEMDVGGWEPPKS